MSVDRFQAAPQAEQPTSEQSRDGEEEDLFDSFQNSPPREQESAPLDYAPSPVPVLQKRKRAAWDDPDNILGTWTE